MPVFSLFPPFPRWSSHDAGKKNLSRTVLPFLKISLLFITLAGMVIFVRFFEMEGVLDPAWADSHLRGDPSGSFPIGGILLYIAMAALLSPVGVPRQALSALGGYAFGALYGVFFSSIGLTMGCAGAFFYSRLLARSTIQRRFGKRIQRLDAFLAHSPFAMTIAVRCFPMGNNALTNLIAGVTTIPAPAFIAGSAIGYLPQTLIFNLLGSGIRIDPLWRTSLSAILFILSSVIGFLLYRRFKGDQVLADETRGAPKDSGGRT